MYDLIHYRDELRGFICLSCQDIIEDENQLLEEIKRLRLSTFR